MDNPAAKQNQGQADTANHGTGQPVPVGTAKPIPEDEAAKSHAPEALTGFHPIQAFWKWKDSPDRRWNKRKPDAPRWTDKAIVLLTAAIVFMAYMQWREMHDSGAQTDRIIAADERIAKAMEQSVANSKSVLDATIKASELDQRAWVGPKGVDVTAIEEGKPLSANAIITNTGKTIALDAKFAVNLIVTAGALDIDKYAVSKERKVPTNRPASVLYPNAEYAFPSSIGAAATSEQIRAIVDGRNLVYLFGEITYSDVFRVSHRTEFCGVYAPVAKKFVSCPQHNRAD